VPTAQPTGALSNTETAKRWVVPTAKTDINNGTKSMEINRNQWKSMEINGNQWKSMEINGIKRPKPVGETALTNTPATRADRSLRSATKTTTMPLQRPDSNPNRDALPNNP
jgi:hypothetical protein